MADRVSPQLAALMLAGARASWLPPGVRYGVLRGDGGGLDIAAISGPTIIAREPIELGEGSQWSAVAIPALVVAARAHAATTDVPDELRLLRRAAGQLATDDTSGPALAVDDLLAPDEATP